MIPDHYATLGVEPTAKATTIRAAYLGLMREYHPDRNRDPSAADRAQAIIAAFKVLGDFDRRNHYDWDRRREREAAQAAAAARPRRIKAGVIAAGAVGLAVAGAWVLTPAPPVEPDPRSTKVAETRTPVTVVAEKPNPTARAKSVAEAVRAKPKLAGETRAMKVEPPPPPVRVAKVEPSRMPPKIERPPPVRVAAGEAIRLPTATTPAGRPPVKQLATVQSVAIAPAAPRPKVKSADKSPAKPIRQASTPPSPTTDLASLDQFVMSFYGQSWRYGDAPKRAALEQSRSSFVVRRGACAADACKRAAYLKLMRDVSEIVESGAPKSR